jgi:precorrin-3B synthase
MAADVRFDAGPSSGWLVTLRGDHGPLGVTSDSISVAVKAARLCAEHQSLMDSVVRELGVPSVAEILGVEPAAVERPARIDRRAAGVHPHPDPDRCNVVAAPFLGRLDAGALTSLACITEQAAAVVRITPDHSLALCGVNRSHLADLLASLADVGLTVDPTEPANFLSACVGSKGCRSAHADTAAEAARLAISSPATRLHLSGCVKQCGLPAGVRHLVADETGVFQDVGVR